MVSKHLVYAHVDALHFQIYKVDNPYLVTFLKWTPILEQYVVGYGFKNGYQRDMCLEKIGLRARVMITILCS